LGRTIRTARKWRETLTWPHARGQFGTPQMGGLLIVLTLNITTLLWAQWNTLVQLTVVSVVVLAGLGFYDDYMKITKASSGGAKSRVKLIVQTALALFIGIYLWTAPATEKLITQIMVPVYKHPLATGAGAGIVGLVLTMLTIVGSSNAVEFDGRPGRTGDWLHDHRGHRFFDFNVCRGCNVKTAAYLQIPYVSGAGELTVFCAAFAGRGAGIFVVTLPSGAGVHGRHGFAGARWRAGIGGAC